LEFAGSLEEQVAALRKPIRGPLSLRERVRVRENW
jgi:hypothetical protein